MEKSPEFRGLTEISPVVDALAARQFDDLVKRVRIFVHPRLAPHCSAEQLTARLTESLPSAPPESSDRSNPTAG
jgi:hypothetical protein